MSSTAGGGRGLAARSSKQRFHKFETDAQINPLRKALVQQHVDSFNFFHERALLAMVFVEDSPGKHPAMWVSIEAVNIERADAKKDQVPQVAPLTPSVARQGRLTYAVLMTVTLSRWLHTSDASQTPVKLNATTHRIGMLPIMVGSQNCWLAGRTPAELIMLGEEDGELGGYFIVNGIERLIRMLIMPRRNFPTALIRPAFCKRGPSYTKFGVTIKCVRVDQSSVSNVMHYLSDGLVNVRFMIRKREYFVPLGILLKAVTPTSDREIYERVTQGRYDDSFVTARAELLLYTPQHFNLFTREQCLAFIGSRFRVVLPSAMSTLDDVAVGLYLIRRFLLVHLSPERVVHGNAQQLSADDDESLRAKFLLLIVMYQKLLALVRGDILPENADAVSNQEVLLGGHLYGAILKDQLEDLLLGIRASIRRDATRGKPVNLTDDRYFIGAVDRTPKDVGARMAYFLATGNLVSRSGLDLQQVSGFTIVADKLNALRYMSHFRSVHRGAFFSTMKTTAVRKLLPESYGFLCPVHTPDGAPCGLLNHLAAKATVTTRPGDTSRLVAILVELGMRSIATPGTPPADHQPVLLDGRLVGTLDATGLVSLAARLRDRKVREAVLPDAPLPLNLEIALIAPTPLMGVASRPDFDEALAHVAADRGPAGQFPGLYLCANEGRLQRPVIYLATNTVEQLGSLEQVYLHVALLPDDVVGGLTTHRDEAPTDMLSFVASMTPFSDYNQSPRNVYQCQMGKQTMGTPMTSYETRTDQKFFRIRTPQAPLLRTHAYSAYDIDDFALGTNVVIAVIAFTGYDMEDAMIINKSSYERGLFHGSVYKTEAINLADSRARADQPLLVFGNVAAHDSGALYCDALGPDGLPHIGTLLTKDAPFYCTLNELTDECEVTRYKYAEPAYVDEVRLVAVSAKARERPTSVSIKLRYVRNPIIGDKFASRHGQKGTLSQLWPAEDMPVSESGLVPDVIINPNAFPSRMTIGMLIEIMAGKAGALYGEFNDATAFRYGAQHDVISLVGEQLRAAGYNFLGNEPMYSGLLGAPLDADIFFGVCYYQRLRHMVSDKFQVRALGPVAEITRQPVKGRKRAGGIRFGEMERDSLLAHGVSFFLHDRFMACSDGHAAPVCLTCGSILSPITRREPATGKLNGVACLTCGPDAPVRELHLPYVFRFLCNELAAMNVRVQLCLSNTPAPIY